MASSGIRVAVFFIGALCLFAFFTNDADFRRLRGEAGKARVGPRRSLSHEPVVEEPTVEEPPGGSHEGNHSHEAPEAEECADDDPHIRSFPLPACLFASVLLVYTLIMEFITERFEHWWGDQKQIMKILSAIYKELMIMGNLAFLLFILEQYAWNWIGSLATLMGLPCAEAATVMFEKVHMGLFALVILYLVNCTYLIIIHVLIYRGWSRVENMSLNQCDVALQRERASRRQMGLFARINPIGLIRWRMRQSDREYHGLRQAFIQRHYQSQHNYPFSLYLKYGMREIVVELVEVHPFIWVAILALLWLNYARGLIPGTNLGGSGVSTEWALFGLSMLLFLVLLGITIKCWLSYRQLLRLDCIARPTIKDKVAAREMRDNAGEEDEKRPLKPSEHKKHGHDHEKLKHSDHGKLFFFARPMWLLRFIQALLLLSTSIIGVCFYYVNAYRLEDDKETSLTPTVLLVIPFIPPILSFTVLLPILLVLLVRLMFTGDLVRTDLAEKARKKHLQLVREQAVKDREISAKDDGYLSDGKTFVASMISSKEKSPDVKEKEKPAASAAAAPQPAPEPELTPSGKVVVKTGGYVRRGSTGSKPNTSINTTKTDETTKLISKDKKK